MKKLKKMITKRNLLVILLFLCVKLLNAQDLESGGSNSWLFHTPDDPGSTTLHIAPKINDQWNWTNATRFFANGSVHFPDDIEVKDIITNGSNSWIFHSPTSSGGYLYFAPKNNGTWDWEKALKFSNNGDLLTRGTIYQNINTGIRISNLDNKLIFKATLNSTELHAAGNNGIVFKNSGNSEKMILTNSGCLGIGTSVTGNHKLAVEGTIGAREIKVEATGWSDFVFNNDYKLKDLEEVENFIEENNHLPDVPSEKEVLENGIELGKMDAKLLQKIEELTLYMIEQNKQLKAVIKKNNKLQKQIDEMRKLKTVN